MKSRCITVYGTVDDLSQEVEVDVVSHVFYTERVYLKIDIVQITGIYKRGYI